MIRKTIVLVNFCFLEKKNSLKILTGKLYILHLFKICVLSVMLSVFGKILNVALHNF